MGYPRFGAVIALVVAKLCMGTVRVDALVHMAFIALAAEVKLC